tara:strand:+ start:1786 stop:1965 length:180 start_codon:yes stop_codon:yes gene_type:complete
MEWSETKLTKTLPHKYGARLDGVRTKIVPTKVSATHFLCFKRAFAVLHWQPEQWHTSCP